MRFRLQTLGRRSARRGFTLIELLTVIAIISLLISILVPSLSRARQQAKNTAIRATIKALSDGLEMFRGENEAELKGGAYPSSENKDDPTIEGTDNYLSGAQWLARYVMGKDLQGYVAPRSVPRELKINTTFGWEQKGWYDQDASGGNSFAPLKRVGPYVDPGRLTLDTPDKLDGYDDMNAGGVRPTVDEAAEQVVILDQFGFPILYYASNPFVANRPYSPIATYDGTEPGIYNFRDNALFTGSCRSGACDDAEPWDFSGTGSHKIQEWGSWTDDKPDQGADMGNPANRDTFPRYIMDNSAFEATDGESVIPARRDTFLMISAGRDGLYGTGDDVTNFD